MCPNLYFALKICHNLSNSYRLTPFFGLFTEWPPFLEKKILTKDLVSSCCRAPRHFQNRVLPPPRYTTYWLKMHFTALVIWDWRIEVFVMNMSPTYILVTPRRKYITKWIYFKGNSCFSLHLRPVKWATLWWFLFDVHPYQPLDFAFFILEWTIVKRIWCYIKKKSF